MTDQEKMREEFEDAVLRETETHNLLRDTGVYVNGFVREAWNLWQTCAAQSAETIARLEKELQSIKNFDTAHRSYKIAAWQAEYAAQKLAASQADNVRLREALERVRPYFEGEHYPDHPDCIAIREALAKPLDTSALDAYVKSKMPAWQPIETAPEDRAVDLWLISDKNAEFGVRITNASKVNGRWIGIPHYHILPYVHPSHWMPFPPSPDKQGE